MMTLPQIISLLSLVSQLLSASQGTPIYAQASSFAQVAVQYVSTQINAPQGEILATSTVSGAVGGTSVSGSVISQNTSTATSSISVPVQNCPSQDVIDEWNQFVPKYEQGMNARDYFLNQELDKLPKGLTPTTASECGMGIILGINLPQ